MFHVYSRLFMLNTYFRIYFARFSNRGELYFRKSRRNMRNGSKDLLVSIEFFNDVFHLRFTVLREFIKLQYSHNKCRGAANVVQL